MNVWRSVTSKMIKCLAYPERGVKNVPPPTPPRAGRLTRSHYLNNGVRLMGIILHL